MKSVFGALLLTFGFLLAKAQVPIYDSGGPLMPEQAAYDVTFYDLDLQIFPEERFIAGKVLVQATVVHPMNVLVLDLDTPFTIIRAMEGDLNCDVARKEG